MLIGVLSFSFATGTLSAIIQSYDSKEAALKEKIATLIEINNEYKFDKGLYSRLMRTIRYDHRKQSKDIIQFMEELPPKLKNEVTLVIH
jgi:hypothetical protein